MAALGGYQNPHSTRFIGFDQYGVSRVFGFGPTADVAETECRKAAQEYVARRRDTGPLDRWHFRHDDLT